MIASLREAWSPLQCPVLAGVLVLCYTTLKKPPYKRGRCKAAQRTRQVVLDDGPDTIAEKSELTEKMEAVSRS